MKFDGYLLCSDMDGTLKSADGTISYENIKAIKYFQENGGLFTFATGRVPSHIAQYTDITPNAPIICLNGAMLYDANKNTVLYEEKVDKKFNFLCIDALENNNCTMISTVEFDGPYSQYKKESLTPSDTEKILNSNYYKLLLIFKSAEKAKEYAKGLRAKYGNYVNIVRSWPEGIEIFNKNCGKGESLDKLKKLIDAPIHTVIGIGDYENDFSLIKCADIGFAVKNAIPELLSIADKVTTNDNNNAAIAEIICSI